jgi:hypothetical protein
MGSCIAYWLGRWRIMSECGCININVCEYVDEESENYRCTREKSDTSFFCDECEETLPAGTLREHEKYLNAKNEEQEHTVFGMT